MENTKQIININFNRLEYIKRHLKEEESVESRLIDKYGEYLITKKMIPYSLIAKEIEFKKNDFKKILHNEKYLFEEGSDYVIDKKTRDIYVSFDLMANLCEIITIAEFRILYDDLNNMLFYINKWDDHIYDFLENCIYDDGTKRKINNW